MGSHKKCAKYKHFRRVIRNAAPAKVALTCWFALVLLEKGANFADKCKG
jgi:hypothetical protein